MQMSQWVAETASITTPSPDLWGLDLDNIQSAQADFGQLLP
jgi:hypothetical protein